MLNVCSTTVTPQPAPRLRLRTVWEVDADPSYDVACGRRGRQVVAIRTRAGRGRIELVGPAAELRPGADSLVLVPLARIRRYRCCGQRWYFWWWEMSPPLPAADAARILAVPDLADEDERLREIAAALRSGSRPRLRLASAACACLLARWLAVGERPATSDPERDLVDRATALMHAGLDAGRPGRIADLAATCGVGERRFRQRFRAVTGRSPKRYMEDLRLQRAEFMIARDGWTVARAAAALGYSSPFHLSKSCRRRYGFPPSAWRTHEPAG